MNDRNNKLENSLMVPEKENMFTRFCKWVKNIFGKKQENITQDIVEAPEKITIPKAVNIPTKLDEVDENSLEYLYRLSDEELDKLDELYDKQIEEAQAEISRLDNILQTYKQNIKKMQDEVDAGV